MIRLVGLDPDDKKGVGKYSMGMRQRLGIAQALLEDADLLILDEPMNGLDNQGVKDMRRLFIRLREQGKIAVDATEEYVHKPPWQALGLSAAIGLVLGLLISRR